MKTFFTVVCAILLITAVSHTPAVPSVAQGIDVQLCQRAADEIYDYYIDSGHDQQFAANKAVDYLGDCVDEHDRSAPSE